VTQCVLFLAWRFGLLLRYAYEVGMERMEYRLRLYMLDNQKQNSNRSHRLNARIDSTQTISTRVSLRKIPTPF